MCFAANDGGGVGALGALSLCFLASGPDGLMVVTDFGDRGTGEGV